MPYTQFHLQEHPILLISFLAKTQHERFAPRSRSEKQRGMAAGSYAPYPTKTNTISFEGSKHLATQIGNTGAIWGLLLFPDPASDPELQLLPVATGEEQRHVPLDDEDVVAVLHLPVAVVDAPRGALPVHLPPVGADLEAVAVVICLALVPHEMEEGHVYRCHPKLERLKV